MTQGASLTIRLPATLKEALEAAAARDYRTLSQYVVLVLAEHLGVRDEQPRPRSSQSGQRPKRRGAKRTRS